MLEVNCCLLLFFYCVGQQLIGGKLVGTCKFVHTNLMMSCLLFKALIPTRLVKLNSTMQLFFLKFFLETIEIDPFILLHVNVILFDFSSPHSRNMTF